MRSEILGRGLGGRGDLRTIVDAKNVNTTVLSMYHTEEWQSSPPILRPGLITIESKEKYGLSAINGYSWMSYIVKSERATP